MESFDPYAEWLGRQPGRPPQDHYELLGLSRFEPDVDLIAHVVDNLRAKIRKVRPGTHLAEWQRLLDLLEAAKICLGDPIAKLAYDESIDTSSHTVNVSGEPVVTQDSPQIETMAPPPEEVHSGHIEPALNTTPEFIEAPPVVEKVDSTLDEERPAAPPLPVIRPTRRKGNGIWRSVRFLLFTLVLLALAIGLVLLKQQRDGRLTSLFPISEKTESVPQADWGTTHERPTDAAPAPDPLHSPEIPATAPATGDNPPADPTPAPVPPMPEPGSSPMNTSADPPGAAPPASPAPISQSPPAPAVDPAGQQAFRRASTAARKALGSRDLGAATKHLNEAVSLAQTDDERVEADRLGVLHAHVDAFWGSLRERMKTLKSGSDFPVGDTMAIVVEAGPESLVLRVNGQRHAFSINAMPHVLAAALAQTLFSNSPNAKALRASFLIVEPDGDRKKAQQLLQEAAQGGAEVDELLAEVRQSP